MQVDFKSFDDLTSTQKLKLNQMTALLEQLDISANNLRKSLGSTINDHLMNTGQLAYNELFYEFESGHGGINFAMLRDEELKTIIETPVANFKLSERINDGVVPDLKRNIKNELTRLFLMGESMPKVSSRLSELGYSSYRRAMTITRTEAGRVQAITRQKAQIEAETLDIQFEKQWVATLDTRTRHNHANLDGVRVNPDGYFTINGHRTKQPHMFGLASEDINCRCRTISVLLDDTEPMLRRDNETGEVVEYKNYRDWESNRVVPEKTEKTKRKSVDTGWNKEYNYIKGEDNIKKAITEFGKITEKQHDIIYAPYGGADRGYIATGNSFYINNALRPGGNLSNLSKDDLEVMDTLSKVIKLNVTPTNIRAFRKVNFDFLDTFLKDTDISKGFNSFEELSDKMNTLKKHSYIEHAFSSMSVDPELNYFPERRIWLDIEIPKGTKAYLTDNIEESELILGTKTIYEFKESSVVNDSSGKLLKITLQVKGETI